MKQVDKSRATEEDEDNSKKSESRVDREWERKRRKADDGGRDGRPRGMRAL